MTAPAASVPTPATTNTAALVQQAIKKVSGIATLPEITAKILKTVDDPKSTAAQLHAIVAHDPALVTRILKVVNSSFYGLPGQVASVERAIVILGLHAIKNIAVASGVGQLFKGNLCEGFSAKDLWTHCVAVGVAARELARQMKMPIADEAFLAGMIHDIGMLVELQNTPEPMRNVCERAKTDSRPFCEIERELLGGLDHQLLGQGLAEMWKFPRSCQLVAGYHHRPTELSGDRVLVNLVHVADTICCQAGIGFNLTAVHQQLDFAAASELKLSATLIEQVKQALPTLLTGATAALAA
jgi:HD-like signal output (HDOD) protein